jgi:hypothetical protein
MIEQQLEFEEVLVKPSQENTYLDKSPHGQGPMPGNRAGISH